MELKIPVLSRKALLARLAFNYLHLTEVRSESNNRIVTEFGTVAVGGVCVWLWLGSSLGMVSPAKIEKWIAG